MDVQVIIRTQPSVVLFGPFEQVLVLRRWAWNYPWSWQDCLGRKALNVVIEQMEAKRPNPVEGKMTRLPF
jgi:hypothetical protein